MLVNESIKEQGCSLVNSKNSSDVIRGVFVFSPTNNA